MTPACKQKLEAKAATKYTALIDGVKNPEQLAEEYLKHARSWVECDGSFCPMAVVVHSDGRVLVTVLQHFDVSTTDAFIRNMANRPEVAYVLFIIDSYVAVCDATVLSVKAVPGRKEAVVCTIMIKTDTAVATWVYDRDTNNKPVFVSDIEWYGLVHDTPTGGLLGGKIA
jgi:hypothetical protein